MARDDYGAISVISDEEREALGLGGRKPDDDEEDSTITTNKRPTHNGDEESSMPKSEPVMLHVTLVCPRWASHPAKRFFDPRRPRDTDRRKVEERGTSRSFWVSSSRFIQFCPNTDVCQPVALL